MITPNHVETYNYKILLGVVLFWLFIKVKARRPTKSRRIFLDIKCIVLVLLLLFE